jgi:methyl-accepting chemotaxis protein
VAQLDQSTQQNAALVEQSAATALSLKGQSEALQRSVGRFRLSA